MNEGFEDFQKYSTQPTVESFIEEAGLSAEDTEKLQEYFDQDPTTSEEKIQKAKWIVQNLTGDRTIEELEEEFQAKRAEILSESGFEDHDYTVTTGNQEGAGAVNLGLKRPEEGL
ncbi:TPA: hypothetical protein DEP58_01845 [Patescibacteria group bacterium]|nr:MAG: hypothetical protein UU98_C0018G0013 [Parcubacteria group bacterium GW2011_GWD2_42_14]HCC05031.1 hypothetical protein [Patescibacteria group bacterium]